MLAAELWFAGAHKYLALIEREPEEGRIGGGGGLVRGMIRIKT